MAVTAGAVYEAASAATSHAIAYPASPSAGDLIVAVFSSEANFNNDGMAITGSFTARVTVDGGPGDLDTYIWTKVATDSESGTESVSMNGQSGFGVGVMFKITGDDYGSYDTGTSTNTAGPGTTLTAPATTAAGSDNIVIRVNSINSSTTWSTIPGTTLCEGVSDTSGMAVSYETVTSTTIPTADFVFGSTRNGSTLTAVIARASGGGAASLIGSNLFG